MEHSTVELIQSMLAPGIMISACGLLLLGTNNKYSIVVNRISILDEEKRKIKWCKTEEQLIPEEHNRLKNIKMQLELLYRRVKFIRNAVLSYTIAVALFIITSVLIGLNFITVTDISDFSLITFLIGMTSVLTGSIYMAREVIWGYRIVSVEVRSI